MFPVQYFGVVSDRSEGQFLSSLVGAMFFGAFFGLAMFAFAAWARRKMEQEED